MPRKTVTGEHVETRLTPEQVDAADAYADKHGLSRSEVLRFALL